MNTLAALKTIIFVAGRGFGDGGVSVGMVDLSAS
jgi:hypothetical protein